MTVHDDAPWVRLLDVPGARGDQAVIPQRAELDRLICQATAVLPYRLTPRQLRFARSAMGVTNAQLAALAEVGTETVGRWLNDNYPQLPLRAHEMALRRGMVAMGDPVDLQLGLGKDDYDTLSAALRSPAAARADDHLLTFRWRPDDPRRPEGPGAWTQLTDTRWLVREGDPAGPPLFDDDVLVFSGPSGTSADAVSEALLDVRGRLGRGDTLQLASPFLSWQVVEVLVKGARFQLVTDIRACLDANPCPRLLRFLTDHADRIRDLPRLHSKLVVHRRAGLMGSANLTVSALKHRSESCLLARSSRRVSGLRDNFACLWAAGEPLRIDQLMAGDALRPSSGRQSSSTRGALWFEDPRRAERAIAAKRRQIRNGATWSLSSRDGVGGDTQSAPMTRPAPKIASRAAGATVVAVAASVGASPAEVVLAEGELVREALQGTAASGVDAAWLLDRMADVITVADLAPDDRRIVQPGCRTRCSSVSTLVNRRRVVQAHRRAGSVALLLSELPPFFADPACDPVVDPSLRGPVTVDGPDSPVVLEASAVGARTRASITAAQRRRRATPTRVGLARDLDEGVFISYRHANGAVTVTMPFGVARRFWDELEPLWHEAIRRELTTCRASSHRRRHSENAARLTRSADARVRLAAAIRPTTEAA